MIEFCHLHLHNEYSLLDGYGSAKAYVKRAKELGFTALGLTNHGNIDGLIKFQQECDKNKINPILGCEAYIVSDATQKIKGEKRGHVTLLIKNQQGYENLCKMLSWANLQGFYYKPRIDFDLLYDHCDGLVILTGCSATFLNLLGGEELLFDLKSRIKNDLYLEIMPHDMQEQKETNKLCDELSLKYKIPLVATNDCHYILPEDSKVQEVLLAIQTKALMSDPTRYRFSINGLYLKTHQEMQSSFSEQGCFSQEDVIDALTTTIEIVEKCKGFRIKKQDIYLPSVPGQIGEPGEFIWKIAEENLLKLADEQSFSTERLNQYFDRLGEEWKIINGKHFAPYFCVVYELVQWCHKNDIMTGPGRGSVGGSLLAYLLRITTVDPIRFNLLFSRFIAEDRIDYPDIDLDFEDTKRHLIREHLEDLYGRDNISSISTFLSMKGRSAIRDVARVFEIPNFEVDAFAKAVGIEEGDDGLIAETAKKTAEGRAFASKYPKELEIAIKLEGQIRGRGQHAAAVVISADNLTLGIRGNLVSISDMIVSNWDMSDSEYVGLMKLDILGLNTLSILNEAKRLIGLNKKKAMFYCSKSGCYFVEDRDEFRNSFEAGLYHEIPFDFEKIPLDNKAVFKNVSDGNTVGVFQLNTHFVTKQLKQIRCDNINQWSDIIALVRPGPFDSGMTQDYIDRKHGKKWSKKHPVYEKIVIDTFGVIIYQEQIMEIVNKVAGLSYVIADKIRKAVAKKLDKKELKPFENAFIDGCIKTKTLSEQEAKEFWEALQSYARYVFNRSHSIEYAVVGYWTAYIKHYWPNEFICAALTYGSDAKKEEIIEEAYRLGLTLILPRVGVSDAIKWIVKDDALYVPFIEIKGVGEKTAIQCTTLQPKEKIVQGFFKRQMKEKGKTKLETILEEIGGFGGEPTITDFSRYFSFRVDIDKRPQYPKLIKKIPFGFAETEICRFLKLDVLRGELNLIKQKIFSGHNNLDSCLSCLLSKETEYGPVPPSPGKFNIAIWGEAPGKDEDSQGIGFIGKSGELLWKELSRYDLYREDFHISNCCKCWPSKSKTPNKANIEQCWRWNQIEIMSLDPCLILVFGNTGLKTFSDKDSGIISLSGTTTWSEKVGCWICWSIHPSAVLHNSSNKQLFENGIKNFTDKIKLLGGLP